MLIKMEYKMNNPDEKYLDKIENVNFNPVFILGLHRSGTSILYKMLVSTGHFNSVTAYHIINYEELLSNYLNKKEITAKNNLTDYIKSQGQKDRGIDRLKITADFAEEYGFLLGRYSSKNNITSKNVKYFNELSKKVQFISNNNKLILLKNPWDLPNFMTIKKLIPNAKFIFIHRHPYKTLSSFIKATKLIMKKENPYTSMIYRNYKTTYENPLMLKGTRFLFSDYTPFSAIYLTKIDSKGVNYYIKNVSKLPKDDFVEITYENLCKTPNLTIKKILDFLKIKSKNKDFSSYIKPRKTNLDPNIRLLQGFIYKNMKNYFERFNYSSNL